MSAAQRQPSPFDVARGRSKPTKPVKQPKVYDMYPVGGGRHSNMSVDYRGTVVRVLATSSKQAMSLANRGTWIDPKADTPTGIVMVYDGHDGRRLWCRCPQSHRVDGGGIRHGSSLAAVRRLIASHRCGGAK